MPQIRNASLVSILRTDFQHLKDPPRLFYVTANLAGVAPTNLGLDTALATPANIPGYCMFIVEDSSDSTKLYLCVPDAVNDQWLYTSFSIAA